MSRGPYPILLMLAMSLPGAARALGLGDIRVDSALNEPLSAQIDIVGATRDELMALTAKVANQEIFQRYGADRPAFLSSATFKVGLDAQGRPVLNVRSADAFSDPLISFLVELRWGKNEVIREYSLLLDPAGLTAPRPASEVAVAAAARATPAAATASSPAIAPAASQPAASPAARAAAEERQAADQPKKVATAAVTRGAELDGTPAGYTHHKIASGDTLRGIARRAGAHSESHVQRMMIAIFRANPNAFDANINRMHRGAVLTLPTAAEVAAISGVDAKREVHTQMTAWRLDGRPSALRRVVSIPAGAPAPLAKLAPTAAPTQEAQQESLDATLKTRIQSLEQSLDDMHKQLASENEKIQDLKQANDRAAAASATPTHAATASPAPATEAPKPILAAVASATPVTEAPKPILTAVASSAPVTEAPKPILAATASPAHVTEAPKPILAAVASPPSMKGRELLGPMAVALALLVGGFAYVRRRMQRVTARPIVAEWAEDPQEDDTVETAPSAAVTSRAATDAPRAMARIEESSARPAEAPLDVESLIPVVSKTPAKKDSTETTVSLEVDVEALERSYLDSLGIDTDGDTTLETVAIDTSELDTAIMKADLNTMVIDTKKLDSPAVNNTSLDYNLLDLDATQQHVHMPSDLHDQVVPERRKNIADVLKMALDRDPHRRDLRMKLLETYYSAASINQRAFLDVVRKLTHERDYLTADDWNKVKLMGRDIAADDILFADQAKEDDGLANCA